MSVVNVFAAAEHLRYVSPSPVILVFTVHSIQAPPEHAGSGPLVHANSRKHHCKLLAVPLLSENIVLTLSLSTRPADCA